MPATLNGIGTSYYGKNNLKAFDGRCKFCKRDAQLREYDTMLWFVVFFVPVIPLGRKHILNHCSRCRKHQALPLAKWEELTESAIAQQTAALAENQDDSETSLTLLRTLAAFDRFDEAEQLARGIQTRFEDQADVQLQIGQWHDFRGRRSEADACYLAALKLEPENLAAKHALALGLVAGGQPDQALALARTSPEITPRDVPGFYLAVAHSYQKLNRHAEALTAFSQVIEAFPATGFDKALRKSVLISEKKAGGPVSILPPISPFRSPRVLIPAAVAAVVAFALLGNHYIATHRTLHIVNGFAQPIEVGLDDEPPVTIAARGSQTQVIAEGKHHAAVTVAGKPLRGDDFEIASGFWGRLFEKPVSVLNAGAGAAVLWEESIYSTKPEMGSARLQVGMPYVAFGDIDYPFVPFPQQLKLDKGRSVKKTRVSIIQLEPDQIFNLTPGTIPAADQLAFAEAHLVVEPENKVLLQSYLQAGAANSQLDRVRAFLAAGLDQTPVRIEWHRMAHFLNATDDNTSQLRQRYAEQLRKDPNNSALLYLQARLEPFEAAMAGYDRAIEADRTNPYPWYAKGYQLHNTGDLAGARTAYANAVALRPADEDFSGRLFEVRVALGELADLERELTAAIEKSPHLFILHLQLLEVLAAADKLSQARELSTRYQRDILALPKIGASGKQAANMSKVAMQYFDHDFDNLLADALSSEAAASSAYLRYQAHLELGQYEAAASELQSKTGTPDAFDFLRLSVGARMSGDTKRAAEWQRQACAQFDQGLEEQRRVSKLLARAAEVSVDDTREVNVENRQKALLLIALAQQSPAHRDELLALAEKLNSSRLFPYYFHRRAIAALREGK